MFERYVSIYEGEVFHIQIGITHVPKLRWGVFDSEERLLIFERNTPPFSASSEASPTKYTDMHHQGNDTPSSSSSVLD